MYVWTTRAAFTNYMKSSAHQISNDRIPTALNALIRLERLDHLHTYEVVAT